MKAFKASYCPVFVILVAVFLFTGATQSTRAVDLSGGMPALVDIDADGDLDLFVADSLLRNDGRAGFGCWTLVGPSSGHEIPGDLMGWHVTFADIDDDGDQDMFGSASYDGGVAFCRNTGDATNASWTNMTSDYVVLGTDFGLENIEFVDIDGDGDLDLFGGGDDSKVRYYRNDGTPQEASWTYVTGDYLPEDPHHWSLFPWSIPAFADVDKDGDQDLLITRSQGPLRFYRNDGTPSLPDWTLVTDAFASIDIGCYRGATLGDVDGDGDQDLFLYLSRDDHYEPVGRCVFYRNDGTATSPNWTQVPFSADSVPSHFEEPDFDGDVQADVTVYHPVSGTWYLLQSSLGSRSISWGWWETIPVPADYDGNGRTDIAVYHPGGGVWYIIQSASGTVRTQSWGWRETVPVPADYDGDGQADYAVYHPASGTWYLLQSSLGFRQVSWGWWESVPVPADYDGDGRIDIAVYHPATGNWYILQSASGTMRTQNWGWWETIPVPGDYDGDNIADLAVYCVRRHQWFLLQSSSPALVMTFGQWWPWEPQPSAVPSDYDGDLKTDPAVYYPASGDWEILETTDPRFPDQMLGRWMNWGWSETRPVHLQYQINRWYGLCP